MRSEHYTLTHVPCEHFFPSVVQEGEPLFATPCCNISRATWSTPSEPSHKEPFFEDLSFSALFGTGCCCQLVCFEFVVLHFRLPIPETRNGQIIEHVRTEKKQDLAPPSRARGAFSCRCANAAILNATANSCVTFLLCNPAWLLLYSSH